jgi:hypothetical protein
MHTKCADLNRRGREFLLAKDPVSNRETFWFRFTVKVHHERLRRVGRIKMSALNLRLPDSIHRHVRDIAKRDGVSINLFITSAVSEKISALTTEDYIAKRAAAAQKGAFKKVLHQVPKRKPLPGDEL